jgi:hypothetical protein
MALVFGVALSDTGFRIIEYLFDRRSPPVNVTEVWWPLAQSVLDGGELYLSHWDNKPPLWELLNVGVAFVSGESLTVYMILFWLLVGVANAIAALLLWHLLSNRGHHTAGMFAALAYVSFLGIANGQQVDPRAFANVLLVISFIASSRYLSGTAIAGAGLLSQFATFAIPPLLWYQLKTTTDDRLRYAAGFCLSGVALVGVSFGIVAVVWSPDAAITGFQYSYLSLSEYTMGYVERGLSAAGNPVGWAFYEARTVRDHVMWYTFGALAVWGWYREADGYRGPFIPATACAVALLSAPRLIRQGPLYRFLPFVLLMGISALGVQWLFRRMRDD